MVYVSYARVCVLSRFSHVQLCATLWTVACQAPLSMGWSKQEYWSGLPCPPPGFKLKRLLFYEASTLHLVKKW